MKKKYFLLSVVGLLIFIISFCSGYTYAYVRGLEKTNDMQVVTHSSILISYSLVLTEKLSSPDIEKLIEATEENGDSLVSLINAFKVPIENPEISKLVEIALTRWEQAKERLQELSLQSKNTNNSSDDPSNPGAH